MKENSEAAPDDVYQQDLYEREEPKEQTLHVIVFRLNQEWYAVKIQDVKEVVKIGRLTYLPSSPKHIAGIVNLRGSILSVTDLKPLFFLPAKPPTEKTRLIAVRSEDLETALLVDELIESIEVPVSKIGAKLPTLAGETAKYVDGQWSAGNKIIALLDVKKVLETKG